MPAILSSLSSVLTGTVTEEFKKLVQPASLVAAAIFLTLNLVILFPVLIEKEVPFAVAIEGMDNIVQILLGTLVLVALGYLISSLASVFLSLVSGSSLADTWLVQNTLVRLHQRRFDALREALEGNDGEPSEPIQPGLHAEHPDDQERREQETQEKANVQAQALYKLAYYYPKDRARIGPTRLANVLSSLASYTWHQHGAYLDILWPMIEPEVKGKNTDMQGRIQGNRASLLFLTSLSVLLLVVAVEILALRVWTGLPGLPGVWLLLLVILIYLAYRAAVQEALDWGRDVRAAFDLYLESAASGLGLRPLDSYGQEGIRKARWQKVSWWLTHGAVAFPEGSGLAKPEPEPGWYHPAPAPAPALAVTPSPGCAVEKRNVLLDEWETHRLAPSQYRLPGRKLQYLFAVTNTGDAETAQRAGGCYLIVRDSRLKVVPDDAPATLTGAGIWNPTGLQVLGSRQRGKNEVLVWNLGDIPAQGSRVLTYTINSEMWVHVSPAPAEITELSFDEREGKVKAAFNSESAGNLNITAQVVNTDQLRGNAAYSVQGGAAGNVPTVVDPVQKQGRWTIHGVPAGTRVDFIFSLRQV